MNEKQSAASVSSGSSSSSTMVSEKDDQQQKVEDTRPDPIDQDYDIEEHANQFGLDGSPLETIKTSASRKAAEQPTTTISRTLSLVRTSDTLDPGPPPDGGALAWSQACLAHLVSFNIWGYINSFGMFQSYYVSEMGIGTNSEVAWIGSLQVFILFGLGAFSGRALDAGYFKLVFISGFTISLFGMFMLSLSTKYYQVLLAQGVCQGLGYGLAFVPSIALTSTYFLRRRATALGIVVTGSATGGLVFPAIAKEMLSSAGFAWTVRTMAFVQLALATICAIFMKPRLPPRKAGPVVELSAFKEAPYALYLSGAFFMFWSVYIGFFYVTSYGKSVLGMSQSDSISLLLVINGMGAVGRLSVNIVADYLGPLNMIIPFLFGTSLISYCWIAVESTTGFWIFTVFYGLIAAGLQGLFPVVLTSLTSNPKKIGVRSGMGFAFVGFAVLTGPAIAGALIELMDGSYLGLQVYAGTSMLVSGIIMIFARWALCRQRGLGWTWLVHM